MRPISPPIALRATDINIAQELHFYFFETRSTAALTLALRRIETKRARRESPLPRHFRLREQFPNIVKGSDVHHRIGTRRSAECGLIHHYDASQLLPP